MSSPLGVARLRAALGIEGCPNAKDSCPGTAPSRGRNEMILQSFPASWGWSSFYVHPPPGPGLLCLLTR